MVSASILGILRLRPRSYVARPALRMTVLGIVFPPSINDEFRAIVNAGTNKTFAAVVPLCKLRVTPSKRSNRARIRVFSRNHRR